MDVILPCLDESAAIPRVLAGLPPGARALVVDNGSTDGSALVAEQLGASVIHCGAKGYGAACHAGLLAATSDVVAFCDCDDSIDLTGLMTLAAPVVAGRADLAVGRRVPTTRGAWPSYARLANAALAWRLRRIGLPVRDVSPLRIARRADLLALDQQDRRSGYPLETLVLAGRAGWRVVERDIAYRPRIGTSKVTGTVRGTAQAMRDMSGVLGRC
ncbi:glycosyltransferase [Luteipulveratus mongoliensis]|uniref:Glycosyltransferase n=1 Tax=Luteipulveratus mongoliensis TaxID=571913 RepID=A0A0K1JR42_9MICO|nr:glycosyltransferase [Luteipulveratus mongoliensis]